MELTVQEVYCTESQEQFGLELVVAISISVTVNRRECLMHSGSPMCYQTCMSL